MKKKKNAKCDLHAKFKHKWRSILERIKWGSRDEDEVDPKKYRRQADEKQFTQEKILKMLVYRRDAMCC